MAQSKEVGTAKVTPRSFARTQLDLLSREQTAELEETALLLAQTPPLTLARAGLAILNLVIAAQRTGLGGKTVVELEIDSAIKSSNEKKGKNDSGTNGNDKSSSGSLSEHGIRTGDIVGLAEQPAGSAKKSEKSDLKKKGVEGVVIRTQADKISVAVDERGGSKDGDEGESVDRLEGKRLWLVKLANDVTYKRMKQVMTKMQNMDDSEYSPFMQTIFGLSSVSSVNVDSLSLSGSDNDIEWFDPTMNDSQKDAVRFAIASREVALIHGPPGTGKTHTLIELILQLLKLNKRLLVCGPSNISVDNIVERLAPHKVPIVRLGHPARLLPSVLNHSLEVLTKTSEAAAIVQDVRKEMDDKQSSIRKTRSAKERRAIYGDLRELRKEYRDREGKCVDNLVKGSKVVLATLHGAGGYQLGNQQFDVVIIDEASQALEAQCWIPLLRANKAVLAGDHLQLPPTIKSLNSKSDKKATEEPSSAAAAEDEKAEDAPIKGMTLETTMFDRLLALHGPTIKRMLTTQYRMHQKIMTFPSTALYDSKLLAAESVRHRLLSDLEYTVKETDDTKEPLIFIDTQGGDFLEKAEEDAENRNKDVKKGSKSFLGDSKSNPTEALLVAQHVHSLISAGVHEEDIAVISPYNAQVSLLSSLLRERYPALEIGSVDGFQGREKEAIVVSLVRSGGEVGFLAEKRRLNVSMTRPRRQLCVVGDSETLGKGSGFLKAWMGYLEAEADLRYPDVAGVRWPPEGEE